MAPLADPALEGTQLPIGERAGKFRLQSRKEVLPDPIGLGLEPRAHTRPHGGEGVRACPPITRRPRRDAMSRADFAVLPRRRETGEESIKVAVVMRRQVRRVAGGEAGEMVLHRPNLLQEAQRIELRCHAV